MRAKWLVPMSLVLLPVVLVMTNVVVQALAGCSATAGDLSKCRHFPAIVESLGSKVSTLFLFSLIGVPIGGIWLFINIQEAISRRAGVLGTPPGPDL